MCDAYTPLKDFNFVSFEVNESLLHERVSRGTGKPHV